MRDMCKRLVIAGVLGVALALPGTAGATITVSDAGGGPAGAYSETQLSGFPGYTPISPLPYDPLHDNGFHNGNVYLTPGVYQFEYWGSGDSAFDNLFTINNSKPAFYSVTGSPIFSDGPGGTGPGGFGGSYTVTVFASEVPVLGTLLDFTFSTSGPPECATETGGSTETCDYLAATQGYVSGGGTQSAFRAFLGFSDRNETADHDHQDLTIRINEVPEPATLGLLGAGLLGLGLIRRRRAA